MEKIENLLKGKKPKSKWLCNHCDSLLEFFYEGNLCKECYNRAKSAKKTGDKKEGN